MFGKRRKKKGNKQKQKTFLSTVSKIWMKNRAIEQKIEQSSNHFSNGKKFFACQNTVANINNLNFSKKIKKYTGKV